MNMISAKRFIVAVLLLSMFFVSRAAGGSHMGNWSKIDRGIKAQTFIQKGTYMFGGTAGYSSLSTEDYKFLLLDNVNLSGAVGNGSLFFGYAFSNNVAGGISVKYSRTTASISTLDLSLGSDLSFGMSNYYNIQQSVTATAFLRTYMNIGKQKRIGLYNDVEVYFGGGQGKNTNGMGEGYSGTYQDITRMGILLNPGIVVFATDFLAFEAGVSIFGIEYSRTEQITNQVYMGSVESFTASFKLNLLKINLGLSFYF